MSQQHQLPKPSAPLVSTLRHDVYSAIDSHSTLANAASSIYGVLVTGSGRGVGRSTALAFARAGARKVVLTSRTKSELEEVKEEIEKLGKGTDVRLVEVDLTKEESVDHLFKEAGELDGESFLDFSSEPASGKLKRERFHAVVLINNAGYLEPCVPIRDSKPADWIRTQEINSTGTYLASRAFLRQVHANKLVGEDRKVTIINTSSIGSIGTRPGFSSYQPGKTFINRFTEFAHFEEPDVRVFAIHP